jgi:hypothetical protein
VSTKADRRIKADAVEHAAKPMREAFESQGEYAPYLIWKRGGSVFAEHIGTFDYSDSGVQRAWEMWQRAWNAALAHAEIGAGLVGQPPKEQP